MMNEVMQQLIPEDLTDRELAAIEESHDAIELIVPDIVQSRQSLVMDSTISRSQEADLSGALEIRGLVLEAEASFGDSFP